MQWIFHGGTAEEKREIDMKTRVPRGRALSVIVQFDTRQNNQTSNTEGKGSKSDLNKMTIM
jgi:hypothetical protein